MHEAITEIAGIEIPSTDPVFLSVVGVHILLGLACVISGAIAMLSTKRTSPIFPYFRKYQLTDPP